MRRCRPDPDAAAPSRERLSPRRQSAETSKEQTAVFAGGCFWGVEAVFDHVKGVKSATSGYSGGGADTARYETVSTGTTGHAESVKVVTTRRR